MYKAIHFLFALLLLSSCSNENLYITKECKLIRRSFKAYKRDGWGYRRHLYITTWDCGKFGILIADDERIFNLSRDVSVLKIKNQPPYYSIEDIVDE